MEAARGPGNRDALLRNACQPMAVEGDTVVLGFFYKFHLEQIEKPENKRFLEDILAKVLGRPYQVRCLLKPKGNPISPQKLVEAALGVGARVIDE